VFTVKLLKEAELDVADACDWYEKQQKGLAKRFLKEVDQYIRSIKKNPNKFNIRFSGKFRFAALKIFPYLIA
jgi:predicted HicB family RNase H-like nuclease